jgi:hypothetical protein
MLPCRPALNKPVLRFELSDNVTSQQYPARKRADWRALATGHRTTKQKSDNAPFKFNFFKTYHIHQQKSTYLYNIQQLQKEIQERNRCVLTNQTLSKIIMTDT